MKPPPGMTMEVQPAMFSDYLYRRARLRMTVSREYVDDRLAAMVELATLRCVR